MKGYSVQTPSSTTAGMSQCRRSVITCGSPSSYPRPSHGYTVATSTSGHSTSCCSEATLQAAILPVWQ